MGEWSKKVGEHGESVVKEFFELIGWADSQSGITLPCIKGDKHLNKKTHGIDRLFSYESPLEDGVLHHLVTSVKFTSEPYPQAPNGIFKSHFLDLTKTLECFKNSEAKHKANKNFQGFESAKNTGVLFWLSNDRNSERDILQSVAGCKGLDEFPYESVYVVDNRRAGFVFDTIYYLRNAYEKCSIEFFYPSTGKNTNPLSKKSSGSLLPVEYINSSVILFKITEKDDKKTLVISTIDEFSNSYLRRLIGLAQEISQDLSANILILFPNFDSLHHDNEVSDAKSGFKNITFTKQIKVGAFRNDFRGIVR